jgi:hypothetical protein
VAPEAAGSSPVTHPTKIKELAGIGRLLSNFAHKFPTVFPTLAEIHDTKGRHRNRPFVSCFPRCRRHERGCICSGLSLVKRSTRATAPRSVWEATALAVACLNCHVAERQTTISGPMFLGFCLGDEVDLVSPLLVVGPETTLGNRKPGPPGKNFITSPQ